jgi:hypothetical protein
MIDPTWNDTLAAAGLRPAGTEPLRFDTVEAEARAAAAATVVAPLAHLAPIAVTGEERVPFLQGQTSNDVRRVDASHAQLTSVNTPKGRVFAIGVLHADGERLLLWSERALIDSLRKRLQMYVLRAKATLTDARTERLAIGISGPETARVLESCGLALPHAVWGMWERPATESALWERPLAANGPPSVEVVRLPGVQPRALIACDAESAAGVLKALASHATLVGTEAWRLTDIHAGVPTVLPETQDLWVAQMLNLDLLGGIHFDKGCYTGQEIIARVHYLGKLKQRLYEARIDMAVAPGAPVSIDGSDGQAVGETVISATDGGGRNAMLAVLRVEHTDGPLSVDSHLLHDLMTYL